MKEQGRDGNPLQTRIAKPILLHKQATPKTITLCIRPPFKGVLTFLIWSHHWSNFNTVPAQLRVCNRSLQCWALLPLQHAASPPHVLPSWAFSPQTHTTQLLAFLSSGFSWFISIVMFSVFQIQELLVKYSNNIMDLWRRVIAFIILQSKVWNVQVTAVKISSNKKNRQTNFFSPNPTPLCKHIPSYSVPKAHFVRPRGYFCILLKQTLAVQSSNRIRNHTTVLFPNLTSPGNSKLLS